MRIFGLDFGATKVKLVEVESTFRRYQIHDYHERDVPPGADPIEVGAGLVRSLGKQPEKLIVCLSSGHVTFRNLNIPTTDRKSVHAAINFELEDDLPFAVDEAVFDYSILTQGRQNTHVHIAATLKKHLSQFLERLTQHKLDPQVITTEAWAYRTTLNRIFPTEEQKQPLLLVHVGYQDTTLYLHWNGEPLFSRQVHWGGQNITETLSQGYNVSLADAEKAKLDNGFILTAAQKKDATQEQIDFSNAIHHALRPLIQEIRQMALTGKYITHQHLDKVYFSGSTALLPGLRETLEEDLRAKVLPLQALQALSDPGLTYSEQTESNFLLAASLAMTAVGQDRSTMINLRKGEFARIGEWQGFNFQNLRKPMWAGVAISICLFLSMAVQSITFQSRTTDVDKRLETALRSFFGTSSKTAIRSYMSNTKRLEEQVKGKIQEQRTIAKLLSETPHSPLDFLRNLSKQIPKTVTVDMVYFNVGVEGDTAYQPTGPTKGRLSFLIANPQMAEKLSTGVQSLLDGFQREKMEEVDDPAGGGKRWKITFSGTPKESAYGT